MSGLDWPGLMRAGMRGLGLMPEQFWRLTPAELALMLGIAPGGASMTRGRLAEMVERFPDGAGGALPRRRAGDSPRYLDKEEAGGPRVGR